jgi:hypothetical protein
MDDIAQRIDDKFITISRLQTNLRQKKLEYACFALGNSVDLPPITSVLLSFPAIKKQKT